MLKDHANTCIGPSEGLAILPGLGQTKAISKCLKTIQETVADSDITGTEANDSVTAWPCPKKLVIKASN